MSKRLSSKPYTPVPGFYHERFTIAIMCNEILTLQWEDPECNRVYQAQVMPQAVIEREGMAYLSGITAQDEAVDIRMDLIRNMPSPVK